jgi:phage gp29-like protein
MPTYDDSAERRAPRPAQAPANRTQEMLQTVSKVNSWRDLTNPLRSLTMPTAVSWLENAQHGVFADLMWAYESAIEPSDADLCCIIDRTDSAIRDCEWQVEKISDETKAFDAVLAQEQEEFLREVYEGIPNLYDAFGFLAMSKFRGFSIINPWFSPADPLSVEQLHCIPHWNIVRDGYSGRWKYNPDARTADFKSLPESHLIAPEEMIRLETRRPVNRIALVKFVRAMTAEKDWDAYVEIYGIPGVFIVAPDNIGEDKIAAFQEAAEAAANQASGALPSGSQVITTQEARSNQPFQPRLEWLQKQLVLAGTGGLLTVLAESGSGTLAGSVHEQAFRQIGRGLARRVSEAFQRQLDKPLLTRAFPGKPVQAYFELKARQEKNVGDFVNQVVALSQQGYSVSPEQVAQETGFDIVEGKDSTQALLRNLYPLIAAGYRPPESVLEKLLGIKLDKILPETAAPSAVMRARGIENGKLQSEDSGTKPESANLQSSISSLQSSTPSSLRTIQATFARLATMAADPAISDAAIQAEADAAIAQFPELLPDLASAIARPMAMDMAQAAVEGAVEGLQE